jgi:hypothetical protein
MNTVHDLNGLQTYTPSMTIVHKRSAAHPNLFLDYAPVHQGSGV